MNERSNHRPHVRSDPDPWEMAGSMLVWVLLSALAAVLVYALAWGVP